jgi:hypothetical protein
VEVRQAVLVLVVVAGDRESSLLDFDFSLHSVGVFGL